MPTSEAPPDYDSLCRDWGQYIERTVRTCGVPTQEVEDLVQEIYAYFVQHDSLSFYRPEVASFATFLRSYVVKRCHSYRRELAKRSYRFALDLSPDAPVDGEADSTIGEVYYAVPDRFVAWLCARSEIGEFLSWLREIDPEEPGDPEDKWLSCRRLYRFALLFCEAVWDRGDGLTWMARYDIAERMGFRDRKGHVSTAQIDVLVPRLKAIAEARGFLGGLLPRESEQYVVYSGGTPGWRRKTYRWAFVA